MREGSPVNLCIEAEYAYLHVPNGLSRNGQTLLPATAEVRQTRLAPNQAMALIRVNGGEGFFLPFRMAFLIIRLFEFSAF